MLLPIHIVIATASVLLAAVTLIFPSGNKLKAIYIMVALTVVTGTYLVFTEPAHMAQVCTTGLIYIAVMLFGIVLTRARLARLAK